MNYEVMSILESDVEDIYKLGCVQKKDFSVVGGKNRFWSRPILFRIIRSESDVALKLLVDEELAGFALVMVHPATKKAYIENFYVISEFDFFELEFLSEVERVIKFKCAESIAYYYDVVHDSNPENLFKEAGYFKGNAHLYLHKDISLNKPLPK